MIESNGPDLDNATEVARDVVMRISEPVESEKRTPSTEGARKLSRKLSPIGMQMPLDWPKSKRYGHIALVGLLTLAM